MCIHNWIVEIMVCLIFCIFMGVSYLPFSCCNAPSLWFYKANSSDTNTHFAIQVLSASFFFFCAIKPMCLHQSTVMRHALFVVRPITILLHFSLT